MLDLAGSPNSSRRIRVCIPSVRRTGGGNERAALLLAEALRDEKDFEIDWLVLDETLNSRSLALAQAVRLLSGRLINLLYLALPFLALRRTPDVMVLMHGNANLLLPYFKWCGIKTLLVCDAPRRRRISLRGALEPIRWRCMRYASRIVTTYDFPTEHLSEVIENPVGLPIAAPLDFSSKRISELVYVGRLAPEKGIVSFLDLAREMKELNFAIFGHGSLEGRVREMAHHHSNIRFAGYNSQWWRHLSAGACLLGCSEVEGCWTTGAEALLSGIPVIAIESETGGPQALAARCSKAAIVSKLDPELVREAVDRLNNALQDSTAPEVLLAHRLDMSRITREYGRILRELTR